MTENIPLANYEIYFTSYSLEVLLASGGKSCALYRPGDNGILEKTENYRRVMTTSSLERRKWFLDQHRSRIRNRRAAGKEHHSLSTSRASHWPALSSSGYDCAQQTTS